MSDGVPLRQREGTYLNESFATERYVTNKPSVIGVDSIMSGSIRWSTWNGMERDKRERETKKSKW